MSAPSRQFRPTTAADVVRDGHRFEWLKPDGWREGFRALVLEVDDPEFEEPRVVGVGRIGPNTVHPGQDLVELEIEEGHRRRGHGTALLHELRKYSNNPLSSKVVPGSARDGFLRAQGAVTYLEVPLLRVDVAADRTARWCAAVRGGVDVAARVVPWTELPREQLIDALTTRYLWQHASWSPTALREVIRPEVGEEFYEESVREHSWAVLRDGEITALADLYSTEGGEAGEAGDTVGHHREGALEAVDAAVPHARADVALCLAALLEDLRGMGVETMDFDNHPTDPHTAPLLATLRRTEIDPVHLVEIPNGLTAVLRDVP
ncbi:GNAT family N-acetyltransferase [uncultured Brachybacterium sp.]|uniref:GNAT family N-acetyltransferase n=1 Tax=uncultured Brachybacterium sp. TaxID=189680 RepID=UPI0026226B1E|nr:GNAT family N-acetyltransferase [uncultured Brachybacterium sp.]